MVDRFDLEWDEWRFSANLGFLWADRPLPEAIMAAKAAGGSVKLFRQESFPFLALSRSEC